jgi:hypothetical protein
MTTTRSADAGAADPIDELVPAPWPWWLRLAVAAAIIGSVGAAAFAWTHGVLRPSPDCCGSGGSSAGIGISNHPGAVTITGYFYNSSPRAVSIVAAHADLPGARVVEVVPFDVPAGFELPPQNLAELPYVVEGRASVWLAVSFVPERCDAVSRDWGTIVVDLEVAGDHWYPTLDRTYELPDAIVSPRNGVLQVFSPAPTPAGFNQSAGPLEAACAILGR